MFDWFGDLGGFIDAEVINNPMYWILTGAAEVGLMIGFKSQSLWDNGSMPLLSMIGVLLLVPIASYFVVWKVTN